MEIYYNQYGSRYDHKNQKENISKVILMIENIQRKPDIVMIENRQAVQQTESEGLFCLDDVTVQTVLH